MISRTVNSELVLVAKDSVLTKINLKDIISEEVFALIPEAQRLYE